MNSAVSSAFTIGNRRFVVIEEEEYKQLVRNLPALPPSNHRGNRDAIKFAEASIARNIVLRREAAGLTQKQLAAKAKMRFEVFNRAERGVVIPSLRTLTKIENALAST